VLAAFIATLPNPRCECFGTHLPAAAIEQDGNRRRSALLLVQPVKERIFTSKRFRPATGERRTPLQVVLYRNLKIAFCTSPSANVPQSDLHEDENTALPAEYLPARAERFNILNHYNLFLQESLSNVARN